MNTNIVRKSLLSGLIVVISLLLAACNSTNIEHLSADQFMEKAKWIGAPLSAEGTAYIGATHTRVYIERLNAITFFPIFPEYTVYWTERNGLSKDFLQTLKLTESSPKQFYAPPEKTISPEPTEATFPFAIDLNGKTNSPSPVFEINPKP